MILIVSGFKEQYIPKGKSVPKAGGAAGKVPKPAVQNVDEDGEHCGGWLAITGKNIKESYCSKISWTWTYLIFGFLITIWIGFTRVIRGQHSYNQVILGWVWGINVSFIFWFNQKIIMDWIKRVEDWPRKKVIVVFGFIIAG